MQRSQADETWMHRLQPMRAAVGEKMALRERKLDSIDAFLERFLEVQRVMIDGTERPVARPQDPEQQSLNYSLAKSDGTPAIP